MKVYKIKHVPSDLFCLAGLRTTKGPGKVWTSLALAKAAISSKYQHYPRLRRNETKPTRSQFACQYRVYEYELSLKGIRHGGDLYE